MKQFEIPEFEIITFDESDIIASSLCTGVDAVVCEEDNCYRITGKIDQW